MPKAPRQGRVDTVRAVRSIESQRTVPPIAGFRLATLPAGRMPLSHLTAGHAVAVQGQVHCAAENSSAEAGRIRPELARGTWTCPWLPS